MKYVYVTLLLCISSLCQAEFSDHLIKTTEPRVKKKQLKNIDYIYMINLDHKPERFQKSLSQLQPYQISPHRFSAVNGSALSQKALSELGVSFQPGMFGDRWIINFPPEKDGSLEYDFLTEKSYGETVFSTSLTTGAIGCTLSHLSILQDAYDAGYETIWILEDDVRVERDPHVLSELVAKLDKLVGKEGWDILYTDTDFDTQCFYHCEEDFESDLKSDLSFYWRPDLGVKDQKRLAKRTILSDDFVQIGGRTRTHSMIIRRSGMKKILDFEKKNHIFIPYDLELAVVPDIKLFNLRYDVVTATFGESDTDPNARKNLWEAHKKTILADLTTVHGWRDPKKAEKLMEFVHDKKPTTCVEIGSFGGYITYPLATTLQFLKKGVVYAIDAWDVAVAQEGLENKKKIQWWQAVNMEAMRQNFLTLIANHQLETYCHPIRKRSTDAVSTFEDGSIDLLFLDGSESRKGSLEDVLLYYPKVREGGYIWLNTPSSPDKNLATAFLLKHCEWLKEESLGIECVVFKKKSKNLK